MSLRTETRAEPLTFETDGVSRVVRAEIAFAHFARSFKAANKLPGLPPLPDVPLPEIRPPSKFAIALANSGDGNGSVANWELKDALAARGANLTMAQVDFLMAAYDDDADGVLDPGELQNMLDDGVLSDDRLQSLLGGGPECSVDLSLVPTARGGYSAIVSALIDSGDHNGSLANWELQAAFADRGSSLPMEQIDLLMAAYDDNSDGVLDSAELQNMESDGVLQDYPGSPACRVDLVMLPGSRIATAMVRWGDNNGSLANWELSSLLASRGLVVSDAFRDTLMQLYGTDTDGDGIVNVIDAAGFERMLGDGVIVIDQITGAATLDTSSLLIKMGDGDGDGKLNADELDRVLTLVNGGEDGITLEMLRVVLGDKPIDVYGLRELFEGGALNLNERGSVSFDAARFIDMRTGGTADTLPPVPADTPFGPAQFRGLLTLLATPEAQHAMDMLEVLAGVGQDNGRFGTNGIYLLSKLSATDDATWAAIAPDLTLEQRQALIDAAIAILDPGFEPLLAAVHGGDGIFESGDMADWLVNNPNSDQWIGPTNQQGAGDCWVLSSLNALASTQWGRDLIDRTITANADGSFTVTFAGDPLHPITVTAGEVAATDDGFSKGDPDMNILEVAFQKYAALYPEQLGGVTDITKGGSPKYVFELMTGGNTYVPGTGFDAGLTLGWLEIFALDGGRQHALVFDTTVQNNHIVPAATGDFGWHALTIVSIDSDSRTVTYSNPWDSGKLITVSFEEFARLPAHIYIA